MSGIDLQQEGERVLTICNACRYCEGYCAVFPAMERRLSFTRDDLHYLANLCHNCGECYYACQYAPPHEFAVNIPQTLGQIRRVSYARYAWPDVLARAFSHNGWVVATLATITLTLAMAIAFAMLGNRLFIAQGYGDFYAFVPHATMAGVFGVVAAWVVLAFAIGAMRSWRANGEPGSALLEPFAWREAFADALTLKYLHGGGAGCTYPDARRAMWRRWFHHLTFYGFMCCFASTTVATGYHYVLGWSAPYPFLSAPVVLGTLGGAGLVAGPIGLLLLRAQRDAATADDGQDGMDVGFTVLLLYTSASGLALLALRGSTAMGPLLFVHLAAVMALFVTLPYGKFVHALYRLLALLKYALERRRPGLDVTGE